MKIFKGPNRGHISPCNIIIGIFDGVRIGRRLILKKLKEKNKDSAVVAFTNHLLEILDPQKKTKPIYNTPRRLEILENLGMDAAFGKDRPGTKKIMKILEKVYNFKLKTVKKVKYQNKIISGSRIRFLINEKKLDFAEKLLNRSFINYEETPC